MTTVQELITQLRSEKHDWDVLFEVDRISEPHGIDRDELVNKALVNLETCAALSDPKPRFRFTELTPKVDDQGNLSFCNRPTSSVQLEIWHLAWNLSLTHKVKPSLTISALEAGCEAALTYDTVSALLPAACFRTAIENKLIEQSEENILLSTLDGMKQQHSSGELTLDFLASIEAKHVPLPSVHECFPSSAGGVGGLTWLATLATVELAAQAARDANFSRLTEMLCKTAMLNREVGEDWAFDRADSDESRRLSSAAKKMHMLKPQHADKQFVYECWLAWEKDYSRYGGPTEFARDMLEKCESLKSEAVIVRWVRGWSRSAAN